MAAFTQINLPLRLGMGTVNCYLLKNLFCFYLIDCGPPKEQAALINEFNTVGYQPGDLKFILINHGDLDHTGNASFLHSLFQVPIVMHSDEVGMAENGDMFWNRENGSFLIRSLSRLVPKFMGFDSSKRFTPEIVLKDIEDLRHYGLNAQVILLGDHSKGSIGILTSHGDLFCSDLIGNTKGPSLSDIVDDFEVTKSSFKKLKALDIRTIYPRHGDPFPFEQLEVERM